MKKLLLSCLLVSSSILSSMAAGHTVSMTLDFPITCYGFCNGAATATVSGGVGPFTYSWSPSGGSAASATGLCAANYTVTVTDNSDMSTATATINITQPPLLTVGASSSPVCAGSCTTLTPLASGGTPAYTYTWCCGLFGFTPSVCPSSTTSYTVTVSDAQGCIATGPVTVTVNPLPAVSVNSPTICAGGTATLIAGGATTYVWSTGATINPLGVSPATTTSYTVTGASAGCTASAVSTVTVMPLPVVTVNSPTICAGDVANLSASGATTYAWSSGATPSGAGTATASPTVTTTYTVTGNVLGCTNTAVSTVTVNPTPTITIPSSYTTCAGSCIGLSASTTPGGASFVWNPATDLSSILIPNPISCPATSITYTVTATLGGCTAIALTIVYVDAITSSGMTTTNTSSCSICDGAAVVAPTGGATPYVYSWGASASLTGLCAGAYSVTITDMNGCTLTDTANIYSTNDVAANFTMVPDSTNAYNFFGFNSSTGPSNTYAWDFGGAGTSTATTPSFVFPSPGVYNVCLIATSPVCGADTLCLPVNVSGTLASCVSLFNIADDTTTSDPNALYVYNLSYGASLTYLWDFGDGTTSTLATPSHIYAGTGPYNLCLTVDNGSGCTDTYCDMLTNVDSLNRSMGLSIQVIDVPPFQGLTTGIASQTNLNSVLVSPNPFNDVTVFEIKSNVSDAYSFELTDVLGKKVKSINGITAKQFEVSRDGLENGIYFYKIYSSESVIGTGKVVIK